MDRNKMQACMLAYEVWKLGATCICPHMNSGFLYGELPEELFLAGCLELLERCDALLLLPSWKKSDGTRDEKLRAIEKRIPIFYDTKMLKIWLEGKR
jgi:hypothetical protein